MSPARLDDRQIERYSRQIILGEVGADGQARLLAASVGVLGDGAAAERVVAYLAAAGVGRLAVTPSLARVVDRDDGDVSIVAPPEPGAAAELDAVVLCGDAARDPSSFTGARHVFWTADGLAAELPPCFECATRRSPPQATTLPDLRDAVLGTVVATEVVKTILGIGTPLGDRAMLYDPERAAVITLAVSPAATCRVCSASR